MRRKVLFILLPAALVFSFLLQDFAVGRSQIDTKKTIKMDTQALMDRINALIEANQKQLLILQSQEKEIQRLNASVEALKKELDDTKAKLESTVKEKNTADLEADEIKRQVSDLAAKIIAESESIKAASIRLLASLKKKDAAAIKEENILQENKPAGTVSQPQPAQPPHSISEQHAHAEEVKPKISPQNEKLMESLANAAVMTGQTVHIQYGEDIITSSPAGDNNKCEAHVTVTKNGAVVTQKKYSFCSR